jgi:hypothetical protein
MDLLAPLLGGFIACLGSLLEDLGLLCFQTLIGLVLQFLLLLLVDDRTVLSQCADGFYPMTLSEEFLFLRGFVKRFNGFKEAVLKAELFKEVVGATTLRNLTSLNLFPMIMMVCFTSRKILFAGRANIDLGAIG